MRSFIAISEGVRRQFSISGSVANSEGGIRGVEGMMSRRGWVLEVEVISWTFFGGCEWGGGWGEGERELEREDERDDEWLDGGGGGGDFWVCGGVDSSVEFCGCCSDGVEIGCMGGRVCFRAVVGMLADGMPGTSGLSWTSFAFSTLTWLRRISSMSASIRASSCRSLFEGGAGGLVFPGGRPRPRFGLDESALDGSGCSGVSLERWLGVRRRLGSIGNGGGGILVRSRSD